MILGSLRYKQLFDLDHYWQLRVDANGYRSDRGSELVTQVSANRFFKVLDATNLNKEEIFTLRIKVKLLEDGYICWLDISNIIDNINLVNSWEPKLLDLSQIQCRIKYILNWIEKVSKKQNKYLWGGTIGPDYDCSGLVQAAFSSQDIWLPRDAYQQEIFCNSRVISSYDFKLLQPGDLLFFGTHVKCDHVGIYNGEGSYWHSSGLSHGRNGIGCDQLNLIDSNDISTYYRRRLRGAGRVTRCHDGMTLP